MPSNNRAKHVPQLYCRYAPTYLSIGSMIIMLSILNSLHITLTLKTFAVFFQCYCRLPPPRGNTPLITFLKSPPEFFSSDTWLLSGGYHGELYIYIYMQFYCPVKPIPFFLHPTQNDFIMLKEYGIYTIRLSLIRATFSHILLGCNASSHRCSLGMGLAN